MCPYQRTTLTLSTAREPGAMDVQTNSDAWLAEFHLHQSPTSLVFILSYGPLGRCDSTFFLSGKESYGCFPPLELVATAVVLHWALTNTLFM